MILERSERSQASQSDPGQPPERLSGGEGLAEAVMMID